MCARHGPGVFFTSLVVSFCSNSLIDFIHSNAEFLLHWVSGILTNFAMWLWICWAASICINFWRQVKCCQWSFTGLKRLFACNYQNQMIRKWRSALLTNKSETHSGTTVLVNNTTTHGPASQEANLQPSGQRLSGLPLHHSWQFQIHFKWKLYQNSFSRIRFLNSKRL